MKCACGKDSTYINPNGKPVCREHYTPEAAVARPMSWHAAQSDDDDGSPDPEDRWEREQREAQDEADLRAQYGSIKDDPDGDPDPYDPSGGY